MRYVVVNVKFIFYGYFSSINSKLHYLGYEQSTFKIYEV